MVPVQSPFSFRPNAADGYFAITAAGEITPPMLLQLHAELGEEAERGNSCLIDFRSADISKLTGASVRELAELPPRFERLAIVVEPGFGYGLGRMYQLLAASRRTVAVFTFVDNALLWLTKRERAADSQ